MILGCCTGSRLGCTFLVCTLGAVEDSTGTANARGILDPLDSERALNIGKNTGDRTTRLGVEEELPPLCTKNGGKETELACAAVCVISAYARCQSHVIDEGDLAMKQLLSDSVVDGG